MVVLKPWLTQANRQIDSFNQHCGLNGGCQRDCGGHPTRGLHLRCKRASAAAGESHKHAKGKGTQGGGLERDRGGSLGAGASVAPNSMRSAEPAVAERSCS